MRTLLVTSAPGAYGLELMLEAADIRVTVAEDGEDGLDLVKTYDYDLVVLDLTIADMSGFDFLRALRSRGCKTPVLALSGDRAVETRISALRLGADDVMTAPFHADELIARLLAIARRVQGHAEGAIRIGPLEVRLDARACVCGGVRIPLTGKEYGIVELLALRRGKGVSKEAIMDHLYGGLDEPSVKIVDVFVCKLRAKLKAACGSPMVETVWGRGYMLAAEPQGAANDTPKATAAA